MGNIFMTGATGFVGRNLLRSLSAKYPDNVFYVLTRHEPAIKSIKEEFAYLGPEQIKIVRGDITKNDLGLNPADLLLLSKNINYVWHLAASTSFDEKEKDAIKNVNIVGTSNVLKFSKKLENLKIFYHMSSAYVAGDTTFYSSNDIHFSYRNPFPEDDLPMPSRFRNTYEETKWCAEKLVRDSRVPFTIFRPGIILGDSKTKDSQGERRMMYGYLLAIYYALSKDLKRNGADFKANLEKGKWIETKLRLLGDNSALKNFVCIDDVTQSILAILESPHKNKTFNLINDIYMTGYGIKKAIQHALKIKNIECVGYQIRNPTSLEQEVMNYTLPFVPYTTEDDPFWATKNLDQAIEGKHRKIKMGYKLFSSLLERFVEREIIKNKTHKKIFNLFRHQFYRFDHP